MPGDVVKGENHDRARFAIKQLLNVDFAHDSIWVMGGIARAFFNNEPMKDADLVFKSKEAKESFRVAMLKAGAIVHGQEDVYYKLNGVSYDTSLHFYADTAEEVISRVDFTICAFAFDLNFACTRLEDSLKDLKDHRLELAPSAFTKTLFPASQIAERAVRYIKYGYYPDNPYRLFKVISNLENPRQDEYVAFSNKRGNPYETGL